MNKVKKSVAKKVTKHTVLSAYTTVDCYGAPAGLLVDMAEDLRELQNLERSELVDAAINLVIIGLAHVTDPTTETYNKARIARDKLGDLMINAKEVAG